MIYLPYICLVLFILCLLFVFLWIKNKQYDIAPPIVNPTLYEINQKVISTLVDGFLIIDSNAKISIANEIAEKILGAKSSSIVGQSIYHFFPSQILDIILKTDNSAIQFIINHGDKKIPIHCSSSTLEDKKDHTTVIICVFRDLSSSQELEEKLKIAESKALESEKLKSAFLSNMSHEVRTPMNAIMGFLHLLLENPDLNEAKRREYVNYINNGTENLLNLIDDMIDVSMLEADLVAINETNFDLNELLKTVEEDLEAKRFFHEKMHIPIELIFPNEYEEVRITASKARLQKVVTKILDNALKFTDEGKIEFGYTLQEKKVLFYIKDSGIGLPDDKREMIFDRFTKLETEDGRLYRGTGLGLSIAKKTVNLMGGEIWVESTVNDGSTFFFTLPCQYTASKKLAFDM